jgi:hypothetical protein
MDAGNPDRLDRTFARLRALLEPHARTLVVVHDSDDNYYLDVDHLMPNRKPLFFGAVRKGKGRVSYHLMPVYVHPELLDGISQELRKRMQGKSCFNFTAVDEERFAELETLTRAGIDAYRADGYL